MSETFAVAAHWNGDFDEPALIAWAKGLRQKLNRPVSLGLVFIAPKYFSAAEQILEILRVNAQVPLLAGCSSGSLIAGSEELEDEPGLVLGLYHLPGAKLEAHRFTQEQVEEASSGAYWHLETGVEPEHTNGWLVFADPFHLDADSWLRGWNEAYAPLPIVGGLASGDAGANATQVYLNGDVFTEGGVAISFSGTVTIESAISQGCTPIGEIWTITKADHNLIHRIGNRPAYEVLVETFNALSAEDQKKAQRNLFVGLVVNEYLEDFHRGDFLIRNLIGADQKTGSIAVGALPRTGQTLQFQRRDADAAREDMNELLQRAQTRIGGRKIYGACLCCCNGRGQYLFGDTGHDARCVNEAFGSLGLSGFFCNGEIGPIGDQSFLHGYTASLALFVSKD